MAMEGTDERPKSTSADGRCLKSGQRIEESLVELNDVHLVGRIAWCRSIICTEVFERGATSKRHTSDHDAYDCHARICFPRGCRQDTKRHRGRPYQRIDWLRH